MGYLNWGAEQPLALHLVWTAYIAAVPLYTLRGSATAIAIVAYGTACLLLSWAITDSVGSNWCILGYAKPTPTLTPAPNPTLTPCQVPLRLGLLGVRRARLLLWGAHSRAAPRLAAPEGQGGVRAGARLSCERTALACRRGAHTHETCLRFVICVRCYHERAFYRARSLGPERGMARHAHVPHEIIVAAKGGELQPVVNWLQTGGDGLLTESDKPDRLTCPCAAAAPAALRRP